MAWQILLATAVTVASPPPKAADADVVRYVVKPRDTLYDLTRSFLVPARTWQALLPLSGTHNPRRLPIGRTLAIPRGWLRFTTEDARLASFRGTVSIDVAGKAVAPVAGLTIGEGARIATAANSFATLLLADRSRVTLPSQSRVTVRQMRRILLTGAIEYRIELEQGRLQTNVTPLTDPSGRYRISTPLTMTAVRGTEFRVAYDPTIPTAATEVLAGTVAVSSTGNDQPALVRHSFGAATDAAGRTRTEALLPAPELLDPGKVQRDDMVELHIAPVTGAAAYRIILASDAGFIDSFAEQSAPGRDFALPDIPDGNQFVRVSAIAPDGLEGIGQTYALSRRLASVHAGTVGQDRDGYRFRWFGAGSGERRYRFQIRRDSPDTAPIVDEVGLTADEIMVHRLPPGIYYWRVAVIQSGSGDDIQNWAPPEKLTIAGHHRQRPGD